MLRGSRLGPCVLLSDGSSFLLHTCQELFTHPVHSVVFISLAYEHLSPLPTATALHVYSPSFSFLLWLRRWSGGLRETTLGRHGKISRLQPSCVSCFSPPSVGKVICIFRVLLAYPGGAAKVLRGRIALKSRPQVHRHGLGTLNGILECTLPNFHYLSLCSLTFSRHTRPIHVLERLEKMAPTGKAKGRTVHSDAVRAHAG